VRSISDDGAYISWFDNSAGGYDVYLQRVDAQGNEIWPHNGVLVADLTLSSTQDYGLAVDPSDNAVLTFQDTRFGGTKITVNKVTPGGALAWGVNGVQVSPGNGNNPKVAATTDGQYVVGWSETTNFRLQRLDANGAPLWAAGGVNFVPATGMYGISELVATDNGGVIALWIRYVTNFLSNKHLYTQKFNTAAAPQWNSGNPVIVFDANSIQNGTFPTFVSDAAGGAVFSWYETGGVRNAYVQHVNAAGAEVFAHNGKAVSTLTANRMRLSPDVAYNAATGEIFCAWTEANQPTENMWGVSAQNIASDGTLAWGNNAKAIVPLSALQTSFVRILHSDAGGASVFWFDQPGAAAHVKGSGLDAAGNFIWPGDVTQPCSVSSGKSRLAAWRNACGDAFIAWGDARADANNIYAQNVHPENGSLGNYLAGDVTRNHSVDIDDLFEVINAWGKCPGLGHCPADLVPAPCGNDTIDIDDLFEVINNWTA